MSQHSWVEDFPAAVTVCDDSGKIIEMNARAVEAFAADGGSSLIGTNALSCHPEPARTKFKAIMEAGATNAYTIEKRGIRKLIYQAPWFRDGRYGGHVELSFEIPKDLPHHKRD